MPILPAHSQKIIVKFVPHQVLKYLVVGGGEGELINSAIQLRGEKYYEVLGNWMLFCMVVYKV